MSKHLIYCLFALSVAPLFHACKQGQKTAATDKPLLDTHWLLRTLNGKAIEPTNVRKDPYLLLESATQRLNGSGGCNNLMGDFVLEGQELLFPQVSSTRMHCPGAMEVENGFIQALQSSNRFRIKGKMLTLLFDDVETATLEAKDQ